MAKQLTQEDFAAMAFERLVEAIDDTQYNAEVEDALDRLRVELMELGLDIRR
jgi:hypothetical protein